jgi:hypothetical protein
MKQVGTRSARRQVTAGPALCRLPVRSAPGRLKRRLGHPRSRLNGRTVRRINAPLSKSTTRVSESSTRGIHPDQAKTILLPPLVPHKMNRSPHKKTRRKNPIDQVWSVTATWSLRATCHRERIRPEDGGSGYWPRSWWCWDSRPRSCAGGLSRLRGGATPRRY